MFKHLCLVHAVGVLSRKKNADIHPNLYIPFLVYLKNDEKN